MLMFARQIVVLVGVALRNVRERLGSAAVITIGIASAVGVLVSTLAIGSGIEMMTMKNVREDRVIVRNGGELISDLSRETVQTIAAMQGIGRDADGKPLVSADVVVVAQTRRKRDGAKSGVTIMGVGEQRAKVYPEIRITAGRDFEPGLHELIVGRSAQQLHRNLEIGKQLTYRGITWTVVGTFEAASGLAESWLMTDAETLRAAFKRSGYAQMTILLESPASFADLSQALRGIPTFNIDLRRESEVRRQESRSFSGVVNFVSYFLGTIMAVGAMMGALNSMYAMVDARRREFATLRALGFASAAIALAVLVEGLILATPGAIAGVALPWLLFNGNEVTFVGLNFSLAVTADVAMMGMIWALLIGIAGGMIPASSAARVPIVNGLRAT